ncbi:MAG: signal recognition particle-docking protein FtsY, partial [Nitrosopumilaceae archaeon]|nr:signal recognition particle-docking protein FtsY [Nitrosopumilaceae archaeon]
MFDSLRKSFSSLSRTLAEKELKEDDIDDALSEMEMSLLQSDVALEVIENICSDLKKKLTGVSVNKKEIDTFVREALAESVSALFEGAGSLDVLDLIREKNSRGDPFIVVFLGINGTGKTTTLAKFAHFLKQNNLTVAVAAADTFRAGAIEQIREHTERLQVKLVAQNYNSDPAAVAKDAAMYAKSHRVNCVLVDTAGRIQTSVNLMQQIEKITKVVRPDLKIFVGDSLAGNDAVSQAQEFHEYTRFDCSILTKSDADAKGGAALSIVKVTSKPILFLGVGQEYGDLEPFKKESFLGMLFGERQMVDKKLATRVRDTLISPAADAEEPVQEPESERTPEPELEPAKPEPEPPAAAGPDVSDDPFSGISNED